MYYLKKRLFYNYNCLLRGCQLDVFYLKNVFKVFKKVGPASINAEDLEIAP